MTTKDHSLPFKGKHGLSVIGDTSNGRYGNLNLNQKHQNLTVERVHSNNFSNQNKKVQNYDLTQERSKSSISWKKSDNKLPSEYLNIHFGSDKNKSKEGKNSTKNKNSSTLSLHIAAYENYIEDSARDSFEVSKDKSNFNKNLNKVKNMALSSNINNPFEFPRQQTDESSDPAIMQFTASQKLLNPNQENGDSVTADKATDSSVSPENQDHQPSIGPSNSDLHTNMTDYNRFAYDDHYDIKAPAAAAQAKTASHYLRLRGLPYSAQEADIKTFFDGLAVDEVQLTQNAEGRASGEAFVGFSTVEDAESGLLRDKNKIGTRYIEVFRIGEVEYTRIRNRPVGGTPGGYPAGYGSFVKAGGAMYDGASGGSSASVVRVRGLPYSCKREELIGFFGGLTVEEVVFGKEPGDVGRSTGEAYVKFRTLEDATSAMELNGQHLGKRYLEIFRSDLDQFDSFKRQMTCTAMPLNAIQTDWPQWYGADGYDWGGYGMPMSAPAPSRGRGVGGYRGRGNISGGPYRGYDAGPPRPSPYDYHGRVYGGDSMAGYDAPYDPYGFPMPPYGGGGHEINYNKIYLRGLPFRVTGQQIADFFAPLNCVEIKLGYLPDGRTSGDGFVEFGTPDEAQQAKQRDRQSINNRYIEIFDNAMKATPGTTYKRIGGTGRFTPAAPVHPAAAAAAAAAAAYQW